MTLSFGSNLESGTAIVFGAFFALGALTFFSPRERETVLKRALGQWLLDGSGLFIQGYAVPALRITIVFAAAAYFAPQWAGRLKLGFLGGLALNLVGVDYLYYWNHRLLHWLPLWPVHATHHTAGYESSRLDLFVTSRNTLWAPLLMVYFWINGLLVFLLDDARGFLIGAAITAALDLWRHTAFGPRSGGVFHRILSPWLITPHEHAWHHSRDRHGINFGANLALWDRLHQTWGSPSHAPEALGIEAAPSLSTQLLLTRPLQARSS